MISDFFLSLHVASVSVAWNRQTWLLMKWGIEMGCRVDKTESKDVEFRIVKPPDIRAPCSVGDNRNGYFSIVFFSISISSDLSEFFRFIVKSPLEPLVLYAN